MILSGTGVAALALALAASFGAGGAAGTQRLGALEVLERYEQSLAPLQGTISFTVELHTTLNGAFSSGEKTLLEKRTIYRDPVRFAVLVDMEAFGAQQQLRYCEKLRFIRDSGKTMFYRFRLKERPDCVTISFRADSPADRVPAEAGADALLDGITCGAHNKSLAEVLREASGLDLRGARERVGGYQTCVLEAMTRYGRHILWVDPEFGFNPRRIAIHKVVGDYDDDYKLGDPPGPSPANVSPVGFRRAKTRSDLIVDTIEMAKAGPWYVPVSARIREHAEYADGQVTDKLTTYRRSSLCLEPSFETAAQSFAADIPDETQVLVRHEHAPDALYLWRKGKVVDSQGHEIDYRPRALQSLLGKPLPGVPNAWFRVGGPPTLNPLIELPPGQTEGKGDPNAMFGVGDPKAILLCFFDMNQRPSRHCLRALAGQAARLDRAHIALAAVQAETHRQDMLDTWLTREKVPFPVGWIEGETAEVRAAWGLGSLPWLILADRDHVVRAEGFAVAELDAKLGSLGR